MQAAFIFSLFITNTLSIVNYVNWTKPYYVALAGYSATMHHNILGLPGTAVGIFFEQGISLYSMNSQGMLNNETISGDFTIYSTLDELDSHSSDTSMTPLHVHGRIALCQSCAADNKIYNPSNMPNDPVYLTYAPIQVESKCEVMASNFTAGNTIQIVFSTWNLARSQTDLDTLREWILDQHAADGHDRSSSYFTLQFEPKSQSIFGEWYSVIFGYTIEDNNFTDIYSHWGSPSQWSEKYKTYSKCPGSVYRNGSLETYCFWMYGLTAIAANEELKQRWIKWPEVYTTKEPVDKEQSESGLSAGKVIGIIVLVLVCIGVVAGGIWFVMKKRKEDGQFPAYGRVDNQYDAM
eukprot:356555_1